MSGILTRILEDKRELERQVAALTQQVAQLRAALTTAKLTISNLKRTEAAEILALEAELAIAGPDKDRMEFMYASPLRMDNLHQAISVRQNNPPDLITVARNVIDTAMAP